MMKLKYSWICLLCLLLPSVTGAQITLVDCTSPLERYAASELQRYYYQLSGRYLNIDDAAAPTGQTEFVLTSMSSPLMSDWKTTGKLKVNKEPQAQGYAIKSLSAGGRQLTVIAGADACGLLYGVYGLLEDHLGMRFYMSGDVFPEKKLLGKLPRINDEKSPKMAIRGFLPWTNFPQSATIYSWNDWRFIIDQATKMRMNFMMLHNYNAGCGHNEMFHNFEYNNYMSRSWMATVKTGHGWWCPPWEVNEYRFGASEIYDDYDFGADYGLHNETLSNHQITAKGATIFRQVIAYAHQRGMKIGLGLDIDLILPEYQAEAHDRGIVTAQTTQLAKEYPELDYLLCFQSENPKKDSTFYANWRTIFNGFYDDMKRLSPSTRMAVSGWGMTPESVASLPKDVICAPISYYSPRFEAGDIYGDREYWGCPWLERDFNSSQYYYPYNVNLSETIRAYEKSSANMTGFYALTWRLTDAISPKMWYISKAPWYEADQLNSSEKVYRDFARANYGKAVESTLTGIINQNEPFATDFAECQETPGFNLNVNSYPLMNIRSLTLSVGGQEVKRIEAIGMSEKNGTQNAPCSEGGECVGYINDGSWLKYADVDFGKRSDQLSIRVASASSGGVATVTIDKLDGRVIARFEVKNTEGWQSWKTFETSIPGISGVHSAYLSFAPFNEIARAKELAEKQLKTIDSCLNVITNPLAKQRLSHLRARILGVDCHVELNDKFNAYKWEDLPGRMDEWASSFLHRIDDISSYGNIMSTQSRFIKLNYVAKVDKLRALQKVKSPSHIEAKGTVEGAYISWQNEDPATERFVVCRNGEEIATLPAHVTTYKDVFDGKAVYSLYVVDTDGHQSPRGIPSTCWAGASDRGAPVVILTSPVTSLPQGQSLNVKFSLVDNRAKEYLSGTLYYRTLGEKSWKSLPFKHRVRAVFAVEIPAKEISPRGIEYYISATDTHNTALFPASAPAMAHTVIITAPQGEHPACPILKKGESTRFYWTKIDRTHLYKIYRGLSPDFKADAASFVTFVANGSTSFLDNGYAFDGAPLKGTYYYRLTSVDKYDNESTPSESIAVKYE